MLSTSFGLKLKTPGQISVNDRSKRRSRSRTRPRIQNTSNHVLNSRSINESVTKRVDCRPINESVTTRWLSTSFDASPCRSTIGPHEESRKQPNTPGDTHRQKRQKRCSTPIKPYKLKGHIHRSSTPKRHEIPYSPLRDTRVSTPTRLPSKRRLSRSRQGSLSESCSHSMKLGFKKTRTCVDNSSNVVEQGRRLGTEHVNKHQQKCKEWAGKVTESRASRSYQNCLKVPRQNLTPRENPKKTHNEKIHMSKTNSILTGFDIEVDVVEESRPLDSSLDGFIQCVDMGNLESLMNFYDKIVNRTDNKKHAPVRSTAV